MKSSELKELLCQLESDIDVELSDFFNNNSTLQQHFSKLVNLVVWDDDSLNQDIINRIDILTDNMDSFNFREVKENISEIKDLLE